MGYRELENGLYGGFWDRYSKFVGVPPSPLGIVDARSMQACKECCKNLLEPIDNICQGARSQMI